MGDAMEIRIQPVDELTDSDFNKLIDGLKKIDGFRFIIVNNIIHVIN
jgi:hypothetical protein